ncbi:MAG: Ribonuclease [Parcubacteria group bacterium ADurb.Bin326]|nr:MAG: Ribonuclease [Parcubacteria group bacterium ADurb.Bin326]
MKITFYGAAGEVTGSCALVETKESKFLVDCGMFQGSYFAHEKNFKPFDFNPKELDFVLLTHAHVDHCGRLPLLPMSGFAGKIYCTPATRDLSEIILLDAAKVIKEEAMKHGQEILYKDKDVISVMDHFWGIDYGKKQRLSSDVTVRFRDAGHILGSAIIEIWIKEGFKNKKIVFSGDLGNYPAPIVRNTEMIDGANFVVVESTYGGRIHEPAELRTSMLRQAILDSIGRGGVLMIPTFALERTQEVLYELNYLHETRQIPRIPIFLDSPLAIEAVEIYKRYTNIFDAEAKARIREGDELFKFDGLEMTRSVDQSKRINKVSPPKVILAGSGMSNGGRILYHLKLYLPNPKSHLLIISYQAEGTLGRALRDGAKKVTIDKEKVTVKAKVTAIGSYSSHADQPKLLHWLKSIAGPKPKKVFVVHGEEKSSLMLADGIKQKLKLDTEVAIKDKTYEI